MDKKEIKINRMRSVKEVTKEYNKLIADVETNEFYKIDLTNRVNCYTCEECGHITKTIDIDAGVTPFMFTCEKYKETAMCSCKNITSNSSFFNDIAPNQAPTFEWYRPTLKQVLKMRAKEDGLLDHILQGGLDYRKRGVEQIQPSSQSETKSEKKAHAILFAEWCEKNDYVYLPQEDLWCDVNQERFTTSELHDRFLNKE